MAQRGRRGVGERVNCSSVPCFSLKKKQGRLAAFVVRAARFFSFFFSAAAISIITYAAESGAA